MEARWRDRDFAHFFKNIPHLAPFPIIRRMGCLLAYEALFRLFSDIFHSGSERLKSTYIPGNRDKSAQNGYSLRWYSLLKV